MNVPGIFSPRYSPLIPLVTQSCMNQSWFLWMYLLFVSVSNRKTVGTARVNKAQSMGCSNCLIRVFQSWLKNSISSLWGFCFVFFFRNLTLVQLAWKLFFFNFLWIEKMCSGDMARDVSCSRQTEKKADLSFQPLPQNGFLCSVSLLPNCNTTVPVTQPRLALAWPVLPFLFLLLLHPPHHCTSGKGHKGNHLEAEGSPVTLYN